MKLVRATIEGLILERPEPTKGQPQGMCLDAGYDYEEVREILREFGFTAHIRPRGEEAKARAGSGLQSTALGGGTGTFVDEPFSAAADPLGQEATKPPGFAPFCLWLGWLSSGWVFG
jgi:hypothetical protein